MLHFKTLTLQVAKNPSLAKDTDECIVKNRSLEIVYTLFSVGFYLFARP